MKKIHVGPYYRRSTRVEAMQWWNKFKGIIRQDITDSHFPKRRHTSLTGREIQIIFNSRS